MDFMCIVVLVFLVLIKFWKEHFIWFIRSSFLNKNWCLVDSCWNYRVDSSVQGSSFGLLERHYWLLSESHWISIGVASRSTSLWLLVHWYSSFNKLRQIAWVLIDSFLTWLKDTWVRVSLDVSIEHKWCNLMFHEVAFCFREEKLPSYVVYHLLSD